MSMDHKFTNFSGITTGGLASSSILDNSPKYYIGTLSRSSRKTLSEGKISVHIFAPNGRYCVYYPLTIL